MATRRVFDSKHKPFFSEFEDRCQEFKDEPILFHRCIVPEGYRKKAPKLHSQKRLNQ